MDSTDSNAISFTMSGNQLNALLSNLIEEDAAFAEAVTVRHLLPWDCIAPEDEITENLYIVVQGLVQILITSKEGRRLVTSVIGPGSIFGEEAVFEFKGKGPTYCAQAVKPSVVWQVPAEKVDFFMQKHPVLRLAMLRALSVRVMQVENRLEEVTHRLLPERLAAELIRRARYADSLEIRLSHQTLADILGTYRETVSAILRDFREAGWVKLGYRRITLLSPKALEEMAGPVRD